MVLLLMALRMWSQGTLGVTMARTVCVEQHRRIRFRHKDTGRTQPGIHETEIFLVYEAVIAKLSETL